MALSRILEEFNDTIKLVGPAALSFDYNDPDEVSKNICDGLAVMLLKIFKNEHVCQLSNDDELSGAGADDELAELDGLVINTAADALGAMAAALGAQFANYFTQFFPLIAKFYHKSRPVSDRSLAIGTLAEIADGLEEGVTQFVGDMLPILIRSLRDEEEEVRSNGAFAVGVLVENSTSDLSSHYSQILQLLRPLFSHDAQSNITDNACGAVARLILKHPAAVPLEQVLPVLLEHLPIKRDQEENVPVVKCLVFLAHQQNSVLMANIALVVKVFAQILALPPAQIKVETKESIVQFLGMLRAHHPSDFQSLVLTLDNELATTIAQHIQ
eukprot:jgi/Hompol1/3989/HPOL_006868-RA